eukprot:582371-Alexandrium_andersonii.AAC.1
MPRAGHRSTVSTSACGQTRTRPWTWRPSPGTPPSEVQGTRLPVGQVPSGRPRPGLGGNAARAHQ